MARLAALVPKPRMHLTRQYQSELPLGKRGPPLQPSLL
jgi:hypothetical protein